jgi:hypothetical protein
MAFCSSALVDTQTERLEPTTPWSITGEVGRGDRKVDSYERLCEGFASACLGTFEKTRAREAEGGGTEQVSGKCAL